MLTVLNLETSFQTWHRGNLVAPRIFPDWENPPSLRRYGIDTESEYAQRHLREIGLLLIGAAKATRNKEHGFSNLSEALLVMALRSPLAPYGFDVQLAPTELEQGDYELDDKGFDIVVTRKYENVDVPFLVLNAKLRALRDESRADGHCYSQRAKAPYVSCSLGNWQVDTRDGIGIDYRTWSEQYVIPHIKRGRGIPHFPEFQRGALTGINRTLVHYAHRVNRIKEGSYVLASDARPLLPDSGDDLHLFEYKLHEVTQAFRDLTKE